MPLYSNDPLIPVFQEAVGRVRELMPDLIQGMGLDDDLFKMLPIETEDSFRVNWTIKDNFSGLQIVSMLDGEPGVVPDMGQKFFSVLPIVHREMRVFNETQMTRLRELNDFEQTRSVDSMVTEANQQLQIRERNRIMDTSWKMLIGGKVALTDFYGNTAGTVQYGVKPTVVAGGTEWTNYSTSTPLRDLRALFQGIFNTSSTFDATAVGYANPVTVNAMLNNTNAADLGGKRMAVGSTIFGLDDVNKIYAGSDLPPIKIYNSSYQDDAGVGHRFLPDGYIAFFGKRPGNQPLGAYKMVKNMVQGASGGGYFFSRTPADMPNPVPPKWEVHRGHNGLPVIYYPSAVRILKVF